MVTWVLYTYFIAALLGRQMIPRDKDTLPSGSKYEDPDLYFPLFIALQVSSFGSPNSHTFVALYKGKCIYNETNN